MRRFAHEKEMSQGADEEDERPLPQIILRETGQGERLSVDREED